MTQRYNLGICLALWLTLVVNIASGQAPSTSDHGNTDPLTTALSEELTPELVRELVAVLLSNEEVRTLLIQRLEVEPTGPAADSPQRQTMVGFLETSSVGVLTSIGAATVGIPAMVDGAYLGFANFVSNRGWGGAATVIGLLALAIVSGLAAVAAVKFVAPKWREQISQTDQPRSLRRTLGVLARRLLLDLGGLLAFLVVTLLFQWLLVPSEDGPIIRQFITSVIVLPWLILALMRFLFSPRRPELRLVYADDWMAKFVCRNLFRISLLLGVTIWLLLFLTQQGMVPEDLRLGYWMNVAIYAWLIWAVWRARQGLVDMLVGGDEDVTRTEAFVARAYPWFAIAIIALTWLVCEALAARQMWHLLDGRQFVTLALILCAPTFDTMIRGLVNHLVRPMTGDGEVAEIAYVATKRSYVRIGRLLVFGLVIWVIARLWQIDFTDLATAGIGEQAAARLFGILLIFAIGYLCFELVSLWINRKLAAEQTAHGIDVEGEESTGGEGGSEEASSRLSTVLPLIRWTAQAAIIVTTVLVALGDIGINITPLLAGAGVIGIAVGFGAQKLVADIVSGVFFLIDDAFRAGEYLDVGGTVGTVEKISIRSMQLRHHRGIVNTIPYGQIAKVANFSRDWVIMKLRFTVPFDTDLDQVKKIFKQIGREMMEVHEFANDFITPFKSQGVMDVDDVGIVVRGKFTTKPGKQFALRKEIYSRVQQAFADNGILFARKQVFVKIDDTDSHELDNSQRKAVASAAVEASDNSAEKKPTG